MSAMTFSRATDEGISAGFDLDGEVTDAGDSSGCGIGDYVDPDGTPGIDNAFARLIPALEQTEAQAVEGLLENAITSGELLLMFEILGLDDPQDDDCVGFGMLQGTGEPLIGTDGELLWGQTLARDPDSPSTALDAMEVIDGRLVARPLTISLPLQVFDVSLSFDIEDGAFSADIAADGSFAGHFAGGLDIAYVLQIAAEENVDPELKPLLESLLYLNADLEPDADGECTKVAVTFDYQAIPAFFHD